MADWWENLENFFNWEQVAPGDRAIVAAIQALAQQLAATRTAAANASGTDDGTAASASAMPARQEPPAPTRTGLAAQWAVGYHPTTVNIPVVNRVTNAPFQLSAPFRAAMSGATLTFQSGADAGISERIASVDVVGGETTITLADALPTYPAAGDYVEVTYAPTLAVGQISLESGAVMSLASGTTVQLADGTTVALAAGTKVDVTGSIVTASITGDISAAVKSGSITVDNATLTTTHPIAVTTTASFSAGATSGAAQSAVVDIVTGSIPVSVGQVALTYASAEGYSYQITVTPTVSGGKPYTGAIVSSDPALLDSEAQRLLFDDAYLATELLVTVIAQDTVTNADTVTVSLYVDADAPTNPNSSTLPQYVAAASGGLVTTHPAITVTDLATTGTPLAAGAELFSYMPTTANGTINLSLALTTASVVNIAINSGTPAALTTGTALAANSLYQFSLAVGSGQTMTATVVSATTASILGAWYVPGQ